MHLLHGVSKLDAKSTENVPLPRVVFRIDSGLHLLVVNHADAKGFLRLGGIKRRSCPFDFGEQLLPIAQRVTQSIEDIFGFEIPEGLELQPLGDILL